MGWPLRMQEPTLIYFVTVRCAQARLLLRPSVKTNDVIGGVLARAVERSGVELFGFSFASNHVHMLVRAPRGNLPQFMQYLLANVSKKVGGLINWKGSFWESRYSAEPVLDEGALLGRVRYILSHGVKEGLVRSCRDWPGLSSLPEFLGKTDRSFRWFNWSRRWAVRSGHRVPDRFEARFGEREFLRVTPLPLERFKRQSAWRRFVKRALTAIEGQGRRVHQHVLGRAGVLVQDPHHRPERAKRSRRPWCHAVSARLRNGFISRYRAFVAAFAMASERWRRGELSAVFPPHAHRPFLSPPRTSLPPG